MTKLISSPEDMRDIARQFASDLRVGDVVLLEGHIGAGKTHFARSIIQHLAPDQRDVPSPTFTIVQTYETDEIEIWHCDLYRLTSPDEALELGLDDAFEDAICLIEWPDRLGSECPTDALTLTFHAPDQDTRTIFAASDNPRWKSAVDAING